MLRRRVTLSGTLGVARSEAAAETADVETPDPLEGPMHQEAVKTAISRFVELPAIQRSVIIIKDMLEHSLEDIADLLDLTVNAVKAHMARGRVWLKAINAEARPPPSARVPSAAVARYAALFNQRDWDGCAPSWRTMSGSTRRPIRPAPARRTSAGFSRSTPASCRSVSFPPG